MCSQLKENSTVTCVKDLMTLCQKMPNYLYALTVIVLEDLSQNLKCQQNSYLFLTREGICISLYMVVKCLIIFPE